MDFVTPEDVKTRLVEDLAESAGDADAKAADALLSRLVTLFAFLEDPDVPEKARAVLSHLFEPYSRLTLVDPSVLEDKNHPARYLLADMVRLLIDDAVPDEDRDEALAKVDSVAWQIIDQYNGGVDLKPFRRGLKEIEQFRKGHLRRAALAKRRAEKVARTQRLREEARDLASAAINRLFDELEITPSIAEFLNGPWHNVVTLTCLRHAPNSDEMMEVLRLARRMAQHNDPEDFDMALIETVGAHLEMVGFDEAEARPYVEQVVETTESGAEPAATSFRVTDEKDLEDFARGPEPLVPGGSAGQTREELEELLSPGQWVQFKKADGQTVQAKLSWKSPITRKLLFVDAQGLKVADRDLDEVIEEVEKGEAILLL
ncbi:MAG: DUF1631 family protein [Xanthomonadales bacterium]|nr:DUF1631 family protein [Xanthomonadales bacterium]